MAHENGVQLLRKKPKEYYKVLHIWYQDHAVHMAIAGIFFLVEAVLIGGNDINHAWLPLRSEVKWC